MDKELIKKIYNDIFLYIQHSNIDLFLCGGASNKSYVSNRDQLRKRTDLSAYPRCAGPRFQSGCHAKP